MAVELMMPKTENEPQKLPTTTDQPRRPPSGKSSFSSFSFSPFSSTLLDVEEAMSWADLSGFSVTGSKLVECWWLPSDELVVAVGWVPSEFGASLWWWIRLVSSAICVVSK